MIGFDLQEVARITDPEALLKKISLPSEEAYIRKFKTDFQMRVASLWAVKEACFKALDVAEGQISFSEIELCHKKSGAPFLTLHGRAKAAFQSAGFAKIEVSISHQKSVVGAVVLCVSGKQNAKSL